ncbi:uncharacterized protein LOC143747598 [Siphateles boraxobius]|uniref:uncharacterized protein LOC143747598 n=1 Tax=Siphateles boraxobius TaxID=180520 RepID=UPI004062FA11
MSPAAKSNQALRRYLSSMSQDGQPIVRYVKDFWVCCHLASLDDAQLIELFRSGLDEDIALMMPDDYTDWTLERYIDLALSLSISLFAVDMKEKKLRQPAVSLQSGLYVTPIIKPPTRSIYSRPGLVSSVVDPALKSARVAKKAILLGTRFVQTVPPTESSLHVSPVEPRLVSAELPGTRHVSAELPEPRHVSAELPEPRHVSAELPEPRHVSAELPEPRHSFTSATSSQSFTSATSSQSFTSATSSQSFTSATSSQSFTSATSSQSFTSATSSQSFTSATSSQSFTSATSSQSFTSATSSQSRGPLRRWSCPALSPLRRWSCPAQDPLRRWSCPALSLLRRWSRPALSPLRRWSRPAQNPHRWSRPAQRPLALGDGGGRGLPASRNAWKSFLYFLSAQSPRRWSRPVQRLFKSRLPIQRLFKSRLPIQRLFKSLQSL